MGAAPLIQLGGQDQHFGQGGAPPDYYKGGAPPGAPVIRPD